ncbi:hypothetical protein IAT38_004437 [Cryptococcus sp. DSM 104549]
MSLPKYTWTPTSGVDVYDFVKKYRPSIITDDSTPWLWVRSQESNPEDVDYGTALSEAQTVVSNLSTRLEDIEEDDSIPTRGKKGVKSKKAVRDEAHDEAKSKLKEISIKTKYTVGKWMFFPSRETVDSLWFNIAPSVADGPLKEAGVQGAKVSPTPSSVGEGESRPHVICLYMDDVYNLEVVRKVLSTLLTCHGAEPSSVKSDLYTMLGIDSNHPTKLRSTVWRPNEVIEGGAEAIKALKAQYKPSRNRVKRSPPKANPNEPVFVDDSEDDEPQVTRVKRKAEGGDEVQPKEKKAELLGEKTNGAGEGKKVDAPKRVAKRVKTAAQRYKEDDIFDADSD